MMIEFCCNTPAFARNKPPQHQHQHQHQQQQYSIKATARAQNGKSSRDESIVENRKPTTTRDREEAASAANSIGADRVTNELLKLTKLKICNDDELTPSISATCCTVGGVSGRTSNSAKHCDSCNKSANNMLLASVGLGGSSGASDGAGEQQRQHPAQQQQQQPLQQQGQQQQQQQQPGQQLVLGAAELHQYQQHRLDDPFVTDPNAIASDYTYQYELPFTNYATAGPATSYSLISADFDSQYSNYINPHDDHHQQPHLHHHQQQPQHQGLEFIELDGCIGNSTVVATSAASLQEACAVSSTAISTLTTGSQHQDFSSSVHSEHYADSSGNYANLDTNRPLVSSQQQVLIQGGGSSCNVSTGVVALPESVIRANYQCQVQHYKHSNSAAGQQQQQQHDVASLSCCGVTNTLNASSMSMAAVNNSSAGSHHSSAMTTTTTIAAALATTTTTDNSPMLSCTGRSDTSLIENHNHHHQHQSSGHYNHNHNNTNHNQLQRQHGHNRSSNFSHSNISVHAHHDQQNHNQSYQPNHQEAGMKMCEWEGCDHHYLDMDEFVKHLEDRHVNQVPEEKNRYFCLWSKCKRNEQEFNARYKLLIHMRVHSGEKPYPCKASDNCTKSFSRLENLKIHMRSHTGEKPYKCNYEGCAKSFTNSSDRIKHHKTHKDPKPYACTSNGCNKRYTDPSSLRKHLRAHKRSVIQMTHPDLTTTTMAAIGANQHQISTLVSSESVPNFFELGAQETCLADFDPAQMLPYDEVSYQTSTLIEHDRGQQQQLSEQEQYFNHSHGHTHSQQAANSNSHNTLAAQNQPTSSGYLQANQNHHHRQQQQHNQLSRSWCAGVTRPPLDSAPLMQQQPHHQQQPQRTLKQQQYGPALGSTSGVRMYPNESSAADPQLALHHSNRQQQQQQQQQQSQMYASSYWCSPDGSSRVLSRKQQHSSLMRSFPLNSNCLSREPQASTMSESNFNWQTTTTSSSNVGPQSSAAPDSRTG